MRYPEVPQPTVRRRQTSSDIQHTLRVSADPADTDPADTADTAARRRTRWSGGAGAPEAVTDGTEPAQRRPGGSRPRSARERGTSRRGTGRSDSGRSDTGESGVRRSASVDVHARRRRLAVILAAVVGAASLAYLLLVSAVLGVRSVDVLGTDVLSADEVRAAAGVPAGEPMLRLDVGAVADRVRRLSPVLAVHVERSWPSTVTVRVTERVPLAFTPAAGGARLVDSEGTEFATVAIPPSGVPELRTASRDSTVAAATVLATLAEPGRETLRAEVVAVRADSPLDVQLTLHGDRTARWGSADESARKAAVLAVLLTQPGSVYDVASPDLPTIR